MSKSWLRALFFAHVGLVLVLTLNEKAALGVTQVFVWAGFIDAPPPVRNTLTLTPFWFQGASFGLVVYNAIGNLLLFVPLGGLLFFNLGSKQRTWWVVVLYCVGLSLLIELVQYRALGRNADVNDLVFNGLGSAAGAVLARRFGAKQAGKTGEQGFVEGRG